MSCLGCRKNVLYHLFSFERRVSQPLLVHVGQLCNKLTSVPDP